MNKTGMRAAVAVLAMAGSWGTVWANSLSDSASANAEATLVTPLTISSDGNMIFGRIGIPSSGSVTASITTAGVQGGSANFVGEQTKSAASFNVSGAPALAYSPTVTFVPSSVTGVSASAFVGKCGSQAEMSLLSGQKLTNCSTDVFGSDSIKLGATLTVTSGASASSAARAGTFTVVVAYN